MSIFSSIAGQVKNGITFIVRKSTDLLNQLRSLGKSIEDTKIPIDLNALNKKVRADIKTILRQSGFRDTKRTREVISRFRFTIVETKTKNPKQISLKFGHASFDADKDLLNYTNKVGGKKHYIKESKVVNLLIRGRPNSYKIPNGGQVHNVLVWLKGKNINTFFHNNKTSITISRFTPKGNGTDDAYDILARARSTAQMYFEKMFDSINVEIEKKIKGS